jgi:hypothetical protein
MMEQLEALPEGVIGFRASGKLHSDDYKHVLIPILAARMAARQKVRVVLVFPTFEGMSAGAVWEDLKLGAEHLTHWKRIALVTDVEWMVHVTRLFGWMTPGELQHFPLDQQAQAVAWAAEE